MTSVDTHRDGDLAVITINRPARLNALDEPCRRQLLAALHDAFDDDTVGAVVLTGRGRAFCTGQDLAAEEELGDHTEATVRDTYNPLVTAIRSAGTPVVAAINGPAVGAGMGLAISCDHAVMGQSAHFACAFSRVALVPDTGTTSVLLRRLGHVAAYEAMTTGRRIGPDEALRAGLVNDVVDDDQVIDHAMSRARELAAGPRLAFELTKRLLVAAAEQDEAALLELEAKYQGRAAATADHHEAAQAFLSRSRPRNRTNAPPG